MPYSTEADVRIAVGGPAKLLALTDLDHDGVADAGVLDAAIAEADALITSYAKKRWEPSSVPLTVKALSARIAARRLRRNVPGMVSADDALDEVTDRKWLEALARGDVTAIDEGAAKGSLVVDKAAPRDSIKNTSRERLKGQW